MGNYWDQAAWSINRGFRLTEVPVYRGYTVVVLYGCQWVQRESATQPESVSGGQHFDFAP